MLRLAILASLLVACGACGDDGDTPTDATPVVDIDNGSCGDQLRFTGEYVDWDNDETFCGIFDATFQVQGDGAMDSTAPNGRFDMCIDGDALVEVSVSPNNSACTTPPSTYALGGIAVANAAMLRAGGFFSARNFTAARQATVGFTPDAAKGHVFVHVDGASRTIAITGTHGEPQANATTRRHRSRGGLSERRSGDGHGERDRGQRGRHRPGDRPGEQDHVRLVEGAVKALLVLALGEVARRRDQAVVGPDGKVRICQAPK